MQVHFPKNDGTELFFPFTSVKQAQSELSAYAFELCKLGRYNYENVVNHVQILAENLCKAGSPEEAARFQDLFV